MAIKYKALSQVTLICKHFEETVDFYVNKVGLDKKRDIVDGEGNVVATDVCFANGQILHLCRGEYPSERNEMNRSFIHMCFQLDDYLEGNRDIIRRGTTVYNSRTAKGYPIEDPDVLRKGVCGCFNSFIKDPDGNDIELQMYTMDSKQLL